MDLSSYIASYSSIHTISAHQQIVEENWHQNYEGNPKEICSDRILDCAARVV